MRARQSDKETRWGVRLSDHARLARYVERFFQRSGRMSWPTVGRITRSFGWTQARLQDAIDGDPDGRTFTSSYFARPEAPFRDHFVENYGEGDVGLPEGGPRG